MGPRLVTTPTDNILSAGHFLPSISSTPTAGSLGLKADRSLSQQGRGAHLQVCCRECLRRRCLLQMPGAAYISANSSELPAVQTHGCSALELPDLLRGRAAFLFTSGHVCARYVPICWDKSTWTAMAWDFVLLFLCLLSGCWGGKGGIQRRDWRRALVSPSHRHIGWDGQVPWGNRLVSATRFKVGNVLIGYWQPEGSQDAQRPPGSGEH